jgi:integrase
MSVRKRSWTTRKGEAKEAFIVDYVDGKGERHIRTFERKGDADAYHAQVRVEVRQGTHVAPSNSITIAEACENWLKRAEAEGLERSTLAQYRAHERIHITPRLGRVKLANVSAEVVKTFRDELLTNLSRPLARKVLVSLKMMLRHGGRSHVADGVTIKPEGRHKRKLEVGKDIPTPAEIRRMVAVAKDHRARALLLLAAFTGLRSSELRGLRWCDVDLANGELEVRQRADRYYAIGSPKSQGSRRKVPLDTGVLIPALKEWKMACPKFDADLVFPSSKGGPVHQEVLLKLIRSVMASAGIRNSYGLHSFRHFFASWCINPRSEGGRELPPKAAQALLGHSSITMTLDVYGHLFRANDDKGELAASVLLA